MELVKSLNLSGSQESMSLNTLSSSSSVEALAVSVDVTGLSKAQRNKTFRLHKVHALKNFPVLCNTLATREELQGFKHLQSLPIPRVANDGVMLLIGQDAPHVLAPLEVKHGGEGEPYAVRTETLLDDQWSLDWRVTLGSLFTFCSRRSRGPG